MPRQTPKTDRVRTLHSRLVGVDPEGSRALEAERRHQRLARKLRDLRQQAGWSQAELAKRAGTSPSTISRLESSAPECASLAVIERIAQALGGTVDIELRLEAHSGTVLDEFADADSFNLASARKALENLHPGALQTIQLGAEMLAAITQDYAVGGR